MEQKEYDKLFVGGDLSGIQKFLYNITTDNASISLKGRSAFIINYLYKVCHELEQNVKKAGGSIRELYCSGGKFYFITENDEKLRTLIAAQHAELTDSLWKEHRGHLGLNIGCLAFREENGKFFVEGHEDDTNTSSGILWKYMSADFARQKNQKFKRQLQTRFQEFFTPVNVGGRTHVCALTGVESADCRHLSDDIIKNLPEHGKSKDKFFLPSVIEQIELGIKLSKEDGILPFDQYASGTNLGILRMDVDGMGKKFIHGFDTLNEYQEFSDRAKAFFEDYIKTKLMTSNDPISNKPYKSFLNIIYAGGDDLFIVGRWDKVIDFAKLVHDKTDEAFANDSYYDTFNSNNVERRINISGGIAIVKPALPIAKAAEMAGDAENAAKQFRNGEKNAFHMFGKTVSWNTRQPYGGYNSEYDFTEHYKNEFVDKITYHNMSKGILHKIMLYSAMADRNKQRLQEGKSKNYSYIWHMAYYLTRYMQNYKENPSVYDFCKQLRDTDLNANQGRNLELIALAARWAEQQLKINKV